jgi:adenosylcobinamide-phosphate synthase
MTFFSVIAALALDQYLATPARAKLYAFFLSLARTLKETLDGGQRKHGFIAWSALVVATLAAVAVFYSLVYALSPLFAWLVNAAILYLLIDFKRVSEHLGKLPHALRKDDLTDARDLLSAWLQSDASSLDANQIARLAIERAFIDVHRHWFAILFWFIVLPGPVGAVLYWLALVLAEYWAGDRRDTGAPFAWFACRAFDWLDAIPQRLTAVTFAVVGNFEDAVYCWRSQAGEWPQRNQGIVLAAGAGALGVKLGEVVGNAADVEFRPALGMGEAADADHLHSTEGMIWRAAVVWVAVLFLLMMVAWFG